MAAEFRCSDCGGDGTRCDCHKKRNLPRPETVEQRIAKNEAEIAANLATLRRMREADHER